MAIDFEELDALLLLQIAGAEVRALDEDEPVASSLQGGALLEALTPRVLRSEGIRFRVRGLSLYAAGQRNGFSGMYFFVALSGTGTIRSLGNGEGAAISSTARTVVQFARDDHSNFEPLEVDLLAPPVTVYTGRLEARLAWEPGDRTSLDVAGTLRLSRLRGALPSLTISLVGSGNKIRPVGALDCPPQNRGHVRHVVIQPVGDAARDGDFFEIQMNQVREIWGRKCGFEFCVRPFQPIHPNLRSETDGRRVAQADPLSQRGGVVYVYFVDGPLPYGGVTLQSSILLANQDWEGDDTLLAHELGHVFRGFHPRSGLRYGYWVGDEKTILKPSGSSGKASPTRNTLHNARAAINPFLDPVPHPKACCFAPDPSVSTGGFGSQGGCRCSSSRR